jgi:cobalamin biosynthesis Mg chelatase CobN
MKRMNWVIGSMLALLLVGGLAVDVSAQQPAAPAAPAQTESKPAAPSDSGSTPPATQSAPQPSGQVQTPQVPSSNVQIESRTERTERVVEQPARFLGMDPTIAMVIGAVLFIVIVVGLVAMSRRTEEIHHTHRV